jgi:hypothetical protein
MTVQKLPELGQGKTALEGLAERVPHSRGEGDTGVKRWGFGATPLLWEFQ